MLESGLFSEDIMKKYANPNPNGRYLIDCPKCGQRKEHHAKGLCKSCYKKQWVPKMIICKSCGRKRPHKAFGLCPGCHTRLHHYAEAKKANIKRYYGISMELYEKSTKKCVSCGFSKIVGLHHLDGDKKNTTPENLIGLCPNCHKMIHSYEFYEEIKDNLRKKGFDVTKIHPSNYVYRRDEHKKEEKC